MTPAHLVLDNTLVEAFLGVMVALAVPVNTFGLYLLNRRQKQGNHHTETIASLAKAIAKEDVTAMPPEELGERVSEAVKAERGEG